MDIHRRFAPRAADLRGATRLATDATVAVTDLVEAVHERIARLPGAGGTRHGRAGGIAGPIYTSVRAIAGLAGRGLDAVLAPFDGPARTDNTGPTRDAIVAALNGVLGDHLAASGNPLAFAMTFRHGGRTLVPDRDALARDLPQASASVVVLVHGLCLSERHWTRGGHDHGRALARDLGVTPVYLRYNSGLHVADNGALLAQRLERLVDQWPVRIRRLAIVGHSMGGLLARSALHQAQASGLRWPSRLRDLVFLGTPHHGAPLERAGNRLNAVLASVPYAAPFARLGRLRSAGITDLRHGNLLTEDRGDQGRFDSGADRRRPVPLPEGVRCFAIAGTMGERAGDRRDRLLGDGLVPLDSALGRHADPERSLAFAADRQWIGHGIGHLALLERPEVHAQLLRWLGPGQRTRTQAASA